MIECRFLCEQKQEYDHLLNDEQRASSDMWLPAAFSWDSVEAIKIAGPDPDELLCGIPEPKCTTLYLRSGSTVIVDIPFSELKTKTNG